MEECLISITRESCPGGVDCSVALHVNYFAKNHQRVPHNDEMKVIEIPYTRKLFKFYYSYQSG